MFLGGNYIEREECQTILREPLLIKDLFVCRSARVSKPSSKASVESRSVPFDNHNNLNNSKMMMMIIN